MVAVGKCYTVSCKRLEWRLFLLPMLGDLCRDTLRNKCILFWAFLEVDVIVNIDCQLDRI